jgi:Holliday junction resolvase
MAMTPEGRVKKAVKKLLDTHGVYYYMPVQNGMGIVGVPDIIACWRGKFLAIETKAPGRKHTVTANQKMQLEKIAASGGIAVVVDDPADIEKLLTRKQ